jgi:ribosomal protein S18 acetylase RimI-like enzyme
MVDERYQRRGVGRRAMELLLERWRALGAAAATLSVVPTNPGAITFYESLAVFIGRHVAVLVGEWGKVPVKKCPRK